MHPAYSVIFFTTASGAGYGLMIWLALAALIGILPAGTVFTVVAFGISVALIAGGLLSSTAHLGRPERAWRAFSQWQTSWLSREGVAAVATFVPIAAFGLGWLAWGETNAVVAIAALATIVGALVTVWCTGMIYASLRTIPAWNRPLVTPAYIVLALATGGVLYTLITQAFGHGAGIIGWLSVLALAAAGAVKLLYWSDVDQMPRQWTAGDATGLGRFGKVRQLEPPHTQSNFVMREMGYKVARKHAEKLRQITLVALAVVPALCLLLALLLGGGAAFLLTLIAAMSGAVGVFTERWLFFAEAEHVVNVFYGSSAV